MTLEDLRNHDGLLSVTDVAATLGLDPETVRRAIRRGELPASKPAGRLRVEPGAVLAWLQETSVSDGPLPATVRAGAHAAGRPSSGGSANPARRAAPGERGSFRERVRRARTE